MSPQRGAWRAVFPYNSQLESKRPAESCQRLAVPWPISHVNKVGTPFLKKIFLKDVLGFFESESDLPTKPQPFPGLEFPLCGIQVYVVLLLYNLLQQTRKNLGSSLSDLPTTLVGANWEKQKPGVYGERRRQTQKAESV